MSIPSLSYVTSRARVRVNNGTSRVLLCALFFAVGFMVGDTTDAQPRGSLADLVDRTATRLEERAKAEGVSGAVRVKVRAGRGLPPARAERVFTPRLIKRLQQGGILAPSTRAPMELTCVVSLETGRFWVVSLFEGGALSGPSSVALSVPADRELLSVFGRTRVSAGAQWRIEHLGEVAPGALDIVLMDTDGDFADELVVLAVDAVHLYRVQPGEAVVDPIRAPVVLPRRSEGGRGWWWAGLPKPLPPKKPRGLRHPRVITSPSTSCRERSARFTWVLFPSKAKITLPTRRSSPEAATAGRFWPRPLRRQRVCAFCARVCPRACATR